MLVPVVVRNDGDGFELVAGFTASPASDSLRGRNARRQVAKLMAAAEWDVIEGVASELAGEPRLPRVSVAAHRPRTTTTAGV